MTAAWFCVLLGVCVCECLQLTNSLENPLLWEGKDSYTNIRLEMAIFDMQALIPSSSSPFIKAGQVWFLKAASQDVIILLLQQISGLLGGCNLSSINSASSPNSVVLNSSQGLSSASPALQECCSGTGLAPHARHCLHHHSLFSRGLFLLSYSTSCPGSKHRAGLAKYQPQHSVFLYFFLYHFPLVSETIGTVIPTSARMQQQEGMAELSR